MRKGWVWAAAAKVAADFLRAWEQRRYPELNTLTAGIEDPAGTFSRWTRD